MKKQLLACALTLTVSGNVHAGWFDSLKETVGITDSQDKAEEKSDAAVKEVAASTDKVEAKVSEASKSTETAVAEVSTTTKNTVTEVSDAASNLDIAGLISSISEKSNVTNEQAEGGVASLFSYAKENLSGTDYTELAKSLPGADSILSKVPDVSNLSSSEGVGGLLSQASQYSDSLKSIEALTKQFEALGLKPEMITEYIAQAQSYLDTETGQQAKALLMQGLSSFTGE